MGNPTYNTIAGKDIDRILQCSPIEEMYEEPKQNWPALNPVLRDELSGQKEPYPGDYERRTCDVLFTKHEEQFWLEVKLSWTYMDDRHPGKRATAYHKHLFSESETEHSARIDVCERLPSLIDHPLADRLCFLLICHYSKDWPHIEADIERLEELGGLNRKPWSKDVFGPWSHKRNSNCSTKAYYWERPAANKSPEVG